MPAPRLFLTASVEEQWRALAAPWLREQARSALRDPRPTVILTPSRAESFYLRARLVEEGTSFLGLRFWTPSDARKFLLAELSPTTTAATRAEQRLLARACAENLFRDPATANEPTLASVIRDPDAFLRAYDLLLGAGWDPAQAGAIYGRPIAHALRRELEKLGAATQAGLHQILRREAASQNRPLLARLLVTGFNATHWPLWDLLRAAVSSAEYAVVALSNPRVFGEAIDQLWISSWEQETKTEALIPPAPDDAADEPPAPFAALADSYEKGVPLAPSTDVGALNFLVTPDLASHIRAIVLQALTYLKDDSCLRLGLVFPEPNALALGVAEELRRLGLPLDDATGSLDPGLFERRPWSAWIALQEEPSVPRLLAWLRACEAQKISSGLDLSARAAAKILDDALGETLVDDLAFLADYLKEKTGDERALTVTDFLLRRVQLPESASFSDFLALVRRALALPGWEEHLGALPSDPPALRHLAGISRRTFLEWLRETTDSQVRTRGADGNHFYGKIHLLIYAQITGQTWTHLILTGLNESVWPRVFETGAFGSRHDWAALNRQTRDLNLAATAQGAQGLGHETVAAGHGHCLLPLERRDLELRDLCAALEGTSSAVCLAALTTEAGRSLLPSDFFNHAFHAKTGRILSESLFLDLARATLEWTRRHESLFPAPAPNPSGNLAATRAAFAARHDATRPFGPCEFAFAQPPPVPIQLSCQVWEQAWRHPATVWLDRIVGASPWPDGEAAWPRTVGVWVHRWFAAAFRACAETNSARDFTVHLRNAADRELHRVRSRARATGLDLYPWWEQVWGQARSIALGLGETLAPLLPQKLFLSEFKLPKNLVVALPGNSVADFTLDGRIDLLLVDPGAPTSDPAAGNFAGCTCWVVDFKTGSAQNLNKKRMAKGVGLQPLLYALAVRALGAGQTSLSLHTFDVPLRPQLSLDDALQSESLFRSLDTFHHAGIFGMRPDAANDYGYSPGYPIATRFIPKNILEAKWALTHGAETADDAEDES